MHLRTTNGRTQPAADDTASHAPSCRAGSRSRRIAAIVRTWLIVVGTSIVAADCRAENVPWCDELLVKFPESLLLEREPLPPPSPAAPTQVPEHSGSKIARTSLTQFEPATALNSPPTMTRPSDTPGTAPSPLNCTCANCRRRVFSDGRRCTVCEDWQILPDGILYPSYVAGEKEPRMGTAVLQEKDRGPILESVIGGRLGLLRYGSPGPIAPQGWQWDLESAAMLRQDFDEELDVEATDFRIGSVITWRRGATALKGGIYHLSSHVGDEFLERHPTFERRNYSRDALLFGVYRNLTDELAAYGEIGIGVRNDGGSEPVELQFGVEYSSLEATEPGGAPFAAVNVHLREEFDFGGALNVLAGWEWRGPESNRRFRVGGQYYTGKEIQWSFFDEDITLYGAGIWYDF